MFKKCIMTPMSECLGFKDFLFPLWHVFWFLRVYTREPDSPDLNLPLPSCEHGQTTYFYLHYCCLLCKVRLTAVTSELLWRRHERTDTRSQNQCLEPSGRAAGKHTPLLPSAPQQFPPLPQQASRHADDASRPRGVTSDSDLNPFSMLAFM